MSSCQDMTFTFETDTNFDGVYDEKDNEVHYDFNYGVLTTRHAFSCGNLFPFIAREGGAVIIGEPSSGGSCCIQAGSDAEGFRYMMSSAQWQLRDLEGDDLEAGCPVDIPIEAKSNRFLNAAVSLLNVDEAPPSYDQYFDDGYYDDSKSVLSRPPEMEVEHNFDNQLDFTPYYGRPMKVTRVPRRRTADYYTEEVPQFVVEPTTDKSDEIQRALGQDEIIVEHEPETLTQVAPEVAANRDIKIDINNPESLPVPKDLNSYVISDTGLLTSKEAFENLAVNVNKEIMLEIPSLNDLSDRFLSHVPTIYSRVIIDEFDVSDMSYMFLISSLLKQGVHIKTVPKVHSINLITDDSHAMIISEGRNNMEYGAIYDDRNSISNIRADFEKTWSIASNLDEAILLGASSGGVA